MDLFERFRCPRCGTVPLVIRRDQNGQRAAVIVAECLMCGHDRELDRAELRETAEALA